MGERSYHSHITDSTEHSTVTGLVGWTDTVGGVVDNSHTWCSHTEGQAVWTDSWLDSIYTACYIYKKVLKVHNHLHHIYSYCRIHSWSITLHVVLRCYHPLSNANRKSTKTIVNTDGNSSGILAPLPIWIEASNATMQQKVWSYSSLQIAKDMYHMYCR